MKATSEQYCVACDHYRSEQVPDTPAEHRWCYASTATDPVTGRRTPYQAAYLRNTSMCDFVPRRPWWRRLFDA